MSTSINRPTVRQRGYDILKANGIRHWPEDIMGKVLEVAVTEEDGDDTLTYVQVTGVTLKPEVDLVVLFLSAPIIEDVGATDGIVVDEKAGFLLIGCATPQSKVCAVSEPLPAPGTLGSGRDFFIF